MPIPATHVSAYIDPGTGSMLFTLLIGLVTTGYFFLRRLIIKMRFLFSGGHTAKQADKEKLPYVIFSDHKRYWNVFKPICDEFERRGIDVAFWTASPDDPALETPYTHVKAEFIGEGNRAFARLNMMSASIVLATTPGLDVLQWKRSKAVDWYVHTFHTVGTAVGYRMFGMDHYDAVLTAGDFQEREIRELEQKRNMPEKEIVKVGCTYLDVNLERFSQLEIPKEKDSLTVLLAPSWGPNSILQVYGKRIIDALLATTFNIIIRPHPQSQTADKDTLDELMREYPNGDRVHWNYDNDNFDVLAEADVMITDFSGVIFDYTLIFDKPVIYTEANYDTALYDAAWLDSPQWRFTVYPSLGIPLDEKQFPELQQVIESVVADQGLKEGREEARREAWAFPGESARRTVDYMVDKYAELQGTKDAATSQ